MARVRYKAMIAADPATGMPRPELNGQSGQIVAAGTTTPVAITDNNGLVIGQSRLTITASTFVPTFWVEDGLEEVDWWDGSNRVPLDSNQGTRNAARAAATDAAGSLKAAEEARSFAAGAIRTIGGAGPDESGDFDPGVFGEATKESLGLARVDNTKDEDKPVSKPQKEALDKKADDSAVVKTTGDQTIDGTKTFQKPPVVPAKSFSPAKVDGLTEALAARVVAPEGGLTMAPPMSKAAYDALATKDPKTIYLTWGG
ncbi:phage upper tail fiber protein [Oerskovia jenensis]|uniref:phage upper tail fiber protein n=1 Tax=Oerskovia jenensis TaxID=162169 RepID=UPI0036D86389